MTINHHTFTDGEALTGIPNAYTLASTDHVSEVEDIMVKNFICTLAEIALAVATRKISTREKSC